MTLHNCNITVVVCYQCIMLLLYSCCLLCGRAVTLPTSIVVNIYFFCCQCPIPFVACCTQTVPIPLAIKFAIIVKAITALQLDVSWLLPLLLAANCILCHSHASTYFVIIPVADCYCYTAHAAITCALTGITRHSAIVVKMIVPVMLHPPFPVITVNSYMQSLIMFSLQSFTISVVSTYSCCSQHCLPLSVNITP